MSSGRWSRLQRRRLTLPTLDAPLPHPEPAIDLVDVSALGAPDLGLIDLLASATLTARRQGRILGVLGASPAVRGFVELVGLGDVIRLEPNSDVEAGR